MRAWLGERRSDGRLRGFAALAVLGTLLAGLGFAGCGRALPLEAAAASSCAPAWTTGWHAAQQAVPGDQLAGRTLRMVIRPQASGDEVRLRLSHRHGDGPLRIGAVTLGRAGEPAALDDDPVPVHVGGSPSAVLEPGAEVLTDPLPRAVRAGEPLTVSLYLVEVPPTISSHPVAMRTAWLSGPGDRTGDRGPGGFGTTLQSWPVLSGLEVLAPRPDGALLVIGDSLVDGVGSTPDGDDRFPDQLATRLAELGGDRSMTVLNAGLSRNRLLDDDPPAGGDAPLSRFDADVARVAGVRDVLLLIGTNDLAAGADGDDLVDGLAAFTDRARSAGLRVFLATIPPSASGGRSGPDAVAAREHVNTWLRTEGAQRADGVVDAAAVLADPDDPERLWAGHDSGDGLHPAPEGYRVLAAAVPAAELSGSPCRTSTAG
ncbi:GDSL-type esterase/lipase family protein [Pseudonocardia nematodicida]|uniref:GDSL-type esterase/lipase family protein n=1 Tax=Pseudonocardia nematodicida TaxID=1206997 RepID=UPI0036D30243